MRDSQPGTERCGSGMRGGFRISGRRVAKGILGTPAFAGAGKPEDDRASVPLAWSHEAQVRVAVVDEHQLGEGPDEGVEAVGAAAL